MADAKVDLRRPVSVIRYIQAIAIAAKFRSGFKEIDVPTKNNIRNELNYLASSMGELTCKSFSDRLTVT